MRKWDQAGGRRSLEVCVGRVCLVPPLPLHVHNQCHAHKMDSLTFSLNFVDLANFEPNQAIFPLETVSLKYLSKLLKLSQKSRLESPTPVRQPIHLDCDPHVVTLTILHEEAHTSLSHQEHSHRSATLCLLLRCSTRGS